MKFQVKVTEILEKIVEVDAADADAAEDVAADKHRQGEIILTGENMKDVDYEVVG